MADTEEQLRRMVMTFRVSELQMLLGYAGKNKTGRKNELQSRALDLVRVRNPSLHQKIRELYKTIQLEMMTFGDRSQPGGIEQGRGGPVPPSQMPITRSSSSMSASSTQRNLAMAPVPGYQTVNSSASRYVASATSTAGIGSSGYSNSMLSMMGSPHGGYPINPDVKVKNLPFFDILGELLKPSSLAPQGSARYQEAAFSFSLTPQQATKIANSRDMRPGKQDYSVQVQMRFCLLETTCEQDDNFPPNVAVKVNEKMCPLPSPVPTNKPGVEPKRPSRPVPITPLCRISPTVTNRIQVSWGTDMGRCYVISVYLVQKLNSDDLLQRLKTKGVRIPDFTKSLIKQKLREDAECEIATTSLRCSLLCPLGKMRMAVPCRAVTCDHLQCFDAALYLQMNERKATWSCPVCDRKANYDDLLIDGYFQEVLLQNSSCTEVTLNKDGSWTPMMPKKESKESQMEKRKSVVPIETLSDSEDESDDGGRTVIKKNDDDEAGIVDSVSPNKRKASAVEIITLSDSDDECGPPPPKRSNLGSSSLGTNQCPVIVSDNSSTGGSDSTKSNDSWSVGEVDHGKRLVFRKSISSSSASSTSGLFTPNAHRAPHSPHSGSASPQVICLDSPVPSPSPPTRTIAPPIATLIPLPIMASPSVSIQQHSSSPMVSITPIPSPTLAVPAVTQSIYPSTFEAMSAYGLGNMGSNAYSLSSLQNMFPMMPPDHVPYDASLPPGSMPYDRYL